MALITAKTGPRVWTEPTDWVGEAVPTPETDTFLIPNECEMYATFDGVGFNFINNSGEISTGGYLFLDNTAQAEGETINASQKIVVNGFLGLTSHVNSHAFLQCYGSVSFDGQGSYQKGILFVEEGGSAVFKSSESYSYNYGATIVKGSVTFKVESDNCGLIHILRGGTVTLELGHTTGVGFGTFVVEPGGNLVNNSGLSSYSNTVIKSGASAMPTGHCSVGYARSTGATHAITDVSPRGFIKVGSELISIS